MQLNIICKGSNPSGQEELQTESVAVTVKEGVEDTVVTKPGVDTHVMCWSFFLINVTNLLT